MVKPNLSSFMDTALCGCLSLFEDRREFQGPLSSSASDQEAVDQSCPCHCTNPGERLGVEFPAQLSAGVQLLPQPNDLPREDSSGRPDFRNQFFDCFFRVLSHSRSLASSLRV